MNKDEVSRFWSRVQKGSDGECWLWIGGRFASGYGRFWTGGKDVRAHKLMYELMVGPVPEGTELRHTCDRKICVNPTHLILGTHTENMRDAVFLKSKSMVTQ